MIFDTLKKITLRDQVLSQRCEIGRKSVLPANLRFLENTGRINAFKLKSPSSDSETPHIYWDSDTAKVMEGMALSLLNHPDRDLENELDKMVDLVVSAQQPDGYINTHYTVTEQDNRWKDLATGHELYCAGHLMEAAVAHYEATGKRFFLDAMCRYADYINTVFGREQGKKRGYPGHEEIELALIKLYRVTKEKRYLQLAKYFIEERGTEPNYFAEIENFPRKRLDNLQAHKPVRIQKKAEGHAVRLVYLACGIVDVASESGDEELLEVAKGLFDNIAQQRMYITGGIGSIAYGEAFTNDYDLSNISAYSESCAAIAMVFLAKRLLDITGDARYAEVMEKSLYNNALSGVNLAGDAFFYSNPLQVNSSTYEHDYVFKQRQKWFFCSCCPTSYSRFLQQLGRFCYSVQPKELRVDIPAAAKINTENYEVEITGNYPYPGNIGLSICRSGNFAIKIRIPDWCQNWKIKVNGVISNIKPVKGYWQESRNWQNGDHIDLDLEIVPVLTYANVRVAADFGRAALQLGPQIYCVESVDNPGMLVHTVTLIEGENMQLVEQSGLLPDTLAITTQGMAVFNDESNELYSTKPPLLKPTVIRAIPYALWQNRGHGDMQIFLSLLTKRS